MNPVSRIHSRTSHVFALSAIAAALLAACGGGGDTPFPDRGSVIGSSLLAQAKAAEIDGGTAASGIQALTGLSKCGVGPQIQTWSTR